MDYNTKNHSKFRLKIHLIFVVNYRSDDYFICVRLNREPLLNVSTLNPTHLLSLINNSVIIIHHRRDNHEQQTNLSSLPFLPWLRDRASYLLSMQDSWCSGCQANQSRESKMLTKYLEIIKRKPLESLLGVVVGIIIAMGIMAVVKVPILIMVAALATGLAWVIYVNLKDLSKHSNKDQQ